MSLRPVLYLLVPIAVLLVPAEGRVQEALPAPVFVTPLETPPRPPLKPAQHEAESNRTREEMFEVAARLRKEHGDKTKNWPPEVWKVFYVAEDAHTGAVARRDYQPPETRLGLDDSVQDFLRGAGGNKGMTMVTGADEACYFIRFRLAPGARMTGERFLETHARLQVERPWTKLIAHTTDTSVYVDLEAGSMASYKNCAGMVRAIVERFIRAQLDP